MGLARRGSKNSAYAYPTLVHGDYMVRTLYVVYVSVVIAASTSVTIEAVLCWIGMKKNGFAGVSFCPFSPGLSRYNFTDNMYRPASSPH